MIVVADTSVLLNLCCVGQQELMPALFGDVFIPPEVRQEFERATRVYSRFSGVRIPEWVREQPAGSVPETLRRMSGLDPGEMAAIALALELGAQAVLMDEAAGRRAAQLCGMLTIGVLGILVSARRAGLLPAVAPVIDQLEIKANFWVAPAVRSEALRQAREKD